jgi:hypothetical protein
MALHLAEISLAVAPGGHALVLLDQGGMSSGSLQGGVSSRSLLSQTTLLLHGGQLTARLPRHRGAERQEKA